MEIIEIKHIIIMCLLITDGATERTSVADLHNVRQLIRSVS